MPCAAYVYATGEICFKTVYVFIVNEQRLRQKVVQRTVFYKNGTKCVIDHKLSSGGKKNPQLLPPLSLSLSLSFPFRRSERASETWTGKRFSVDVSWRNTISPPVIINLWEAAQSGSVPAWHSAYLLSKRRRLAALPLIIFVELLPVDIVHQDNRNRIPFLNTSSEAIRSCSNALSIGEGAGGGNPGGGGLGGITIYFFFVIL